VSDEVGERNTGCLVGGERLLRKCFAVMHVRRK
jgi:hypothetical protein